MFKVGHSANSETSMTSFKVAYAMGNKLKLRLVDTQGKWKVFERTTIRFKQYYFKKFVIKGLHDGAGNEKNIEHIKDIVSKIRELEYVDLFVFCLDGNNPRLTDYIKATINLFRNIFPDFLYHSVIVFNKWTSPDDDLLNSRRKEYQEIFKTEYKQNIIPCYFIDSHYNLEMLRDNDNGMCFFFKCFNLLKHLTKVVLIYILGTKTVRQLHPSIQRRTNIQIFAFLSYLNVKHSACDVRNIVPKYAAFTTSQVENHTKLEEQKLFYESLFSRLEKAKEKEIAELKNIYKKYYRNMENRMHGQMIQGQRRSNLDDLVQMLASVPLGITRWVFSLF